MMRAFRAYALQKLGQSAAARNSLDDIPRSESKGGAYSRLIQGLVRAEYGQWTAAQDETSQALKLLFTAEWALTSDILDTLELLLAQITAEEGAMMGDIARDAGYHLRSALLNAKPSRPLAAPQARLLAMVSDALAALPDPADWLRRRLEFGNKLDRWMGSVLLVALAGRGSHSAKLPALVDLIIAEKMPLPAGIAAKVLRKIAGRLPEAADQLVVLVERDLPSLDHTALSSLLEYHSRQNKLDSLRQTWAALTARFDPTARDKVNFLRRNIDVSQQEATNVQLRQFFGSTDNAEALSLLLTSHVANNDGQLARSALYDLLKLRPRIEYVNQVLGLFAANADADAAVQLFDDAVDMGLTPNAASYTSLISLFANRRDVDNARNVFDLMLDTIPQPDAPAYSAVLNAEVESGEWSGAAQRWTTVPEDMRTAPSVASVMLKAYVLLSAPTSRVLDLFRAVKSPTAYMWSLAMQSAADSGDLRLLRELSDEMQTAADASLRAPRPSVYHFSIMLHAYMRTGHRTEARATYEHMVERDIIPTSITYGMIMQAFRTLDGSYGLEQAMQFAASINLQALQLSGKPRARGTGAENLYGPLISISGQAGQVATAEKYLQLASRGQASVPLYTKLMDAYRQAGRADSVLAIWDKAFELACDQTRKTATNALATVTSRTRDNILCIPLSIALDSLASAGRYFDVRRVWESVQTAGFGFDAQNYNHYATALARTGDVDRAFSIVENILLPRWEEVKARRNPAVRQSDLTPLLQVDGEPMVDDRASASPFRPPNRRHEARFPIAVPAKTEVDVELMRQWRPSDTLWKPSNLTISVLEHAYSQLQDADRRAWLALGGSEEDADPELDGTDNDRKQKVDVVTLPSFANAPVRSADGEPRRSTPRAILLRLNRKYTKTLALILIHRRKRSSARRGEAIAAA